MSTREQEARALRRAWELLLALGGGGEKRIPSVTRQRARDALRHYPLAADHRWLEKEKKTMSKYTVRYPDHSAALDDEPWEFYTLGVWVEPDGYYMSTDSGCSCPTPFESHTEESLTGPLTLDQVEEEALSIAGNKQYAIWNVRAVIQELRDEATDE